MPSKTISLRVEAYEKLKSARRFRGESFSQIVLRAGWPERGTIAHHWHPGKGKAVFIVAKQGE